MKRNPLVTRLGWCVCVTLAFSASLQKRTVAQEMPSVEQKPVRKAVRMPYIFFPHPLTERRWVTSLGAVFTTTPRDITEEVQIRVPAIDFHVLRRLPGNFYLAGRLNSQILQNHVWGGIRWAHPVSDRLSFSLGDDIGYWFGFLTVGDFNTRGNGWLTYPNASIGYRLRDDLLLTFRAESSFNLYYRSFVGRNVIASDRNFYNGLGFLIALEQPFYGKTHFTLAFRAAYSNFNWQFWALYETFERKIFYPQVILGFIL